jgi:hypothetical protein
MVKSIRIITLLALALSAFASIGEAFTVTISKNDVSRLVRHSIKRHNSIVCHASTMVDEQIDEKELVGKLRSSKVTNVNNELVALGDIMGADKSVVVFLRHLG